MAALFVYFWATHSDAQTDFQPMIGYALPRQQGLFKLTAGTYLVLKNSQNVSANHLHIPHIPVLPS